MKIFLMWLYKLPGNTNLFKSSRLDRYSKHNIQVWATGMWLFHHTYDCRLIENNWGNRLWVLKLKIYSSLKIWKILNIFLVVYYFIGKWFFFWMRFQILICFHNRKTGIPLLCIHHSSLNGLFFLSSC